MGFLDKLKKTLWTSFFGKPEREGKSRQAKKKTSSPKKKKKTAKKNPGPLKVKAKAAPKKVSLKSKPVPKIKISPVKVPLVKTRKPKAAQAKPVKIAPVPKPAKVAAKPPVSQGILIGHVTHFFPQVHAAAIKIEAQNLSVGDEIQFKGATTNFKIKIDSMQINRVPVTLAAKGSEIGILVKKRVREGDEVFKL